jgi:hypothetical protein
MTLLLLALAPGCGDDGDPGADAALNRNDAAARDAGDGTVPDGTAPDGTVPDGTAPDAGPGDCVAATGPGSAGTQTWLDGPHQASVTVSGAGCARTFSLSSTQPRRDDLPASPRVVADPAVGPSLSTNHDLFDALYALALDEVRENSVSAISDGAWNGGQPITCPAGGCFETGRKWTFVWTRDTAYAVDLALGLMDPTRARNSLEFKLAERREGGDLQIVQDTGTGGSYPVSSDRVVWAMGAWQLLKFLSGAERTDFAARAYDAIANTIAHDREVVFDPATGLYRGEQSFLDWREQSYPAYVAQDPAQIALSASLSTNLGHLRLLEVGAALAAEHGDLAAQAEYTTWADALGAAIDDRFHHADLGLYGTFAPGPLDPAAVRHFDLLGSAFAVLHGPGDEPRRQEVVRRYPHLERGAPVMWPQQQLTPIYHNRALWPFVTAYWLRAARSVRNDAAVGLGARSLVRGAALNLSSMENLEMVSGAPWVDDGDYSGPVVNSQRQLWSVAGYLSLVHDVIFGLDATQEGIRFAPYVTRDLRATLFAGADSLVLRHLPYRGRRLTVVVHLPPVGAAEAGAYAVGSAQLDGQPVDPAQVLEPADLAAESVLEITLVDTPEAGDTITLEPDVGDWQQLFAPRPPAVTGISLVGGRLQIQLQAGGDVAADLGFNVYRDGVRVAASLPGSTTSWTDQDTSGTPPSHCYTVEAYFLSSGTTSQHARPVCYWGPGYDRVQTFPATTFLATGGTLVLNHGRYHYESWGEPGHTLTLSGIAPAHTGAHLLQVTYGNGAGPVSTGITCAVKRVRVEQVGGGVVASGVLVMPHLGTWDAWADSTFVPVTLDTAHTYNVVIQQDETSVNMSFLDSAALYGGAGGSSGAYNYVNIAEVKLLSLTGNP